MTSNTVPGRPESRYGRQRLSPTARRRIAVALLALVVLAGVALAVLGYQRLGAGSSDVRGEMVGYQLIDDHTVDVTVSVTRTDPSQPAVCIVRARSKDGAETGRREFLVPPSDQPTVQVTGQVKTSRKAVVGDVYGCGPEVPDYLVGG